MKLKSLGLALIILLFLISPALAFDGSFRSFESRFMKLKSFSADFQQIYYDPLSEKKQLASGEMLFVRPGKMQFKYLEPQPLEIIIGKSKMWIIDPLLENVVVQDAKQIQRLKSLQFLFQSKSIEKSYKKIIPKKQLLKAKKGERVYHLAPSKGDPFIAEVHLKIAKSKLISFAFVNHNGGYRILKLFKSLANPKINTKVFDYKIPPDFETIDNLGK